MANLRTNSKKRARTDVPSQDDIDDNVENPMALIRKNLLARSLDIKRLEARLKQMSSESNAAVSRFQQLCDDNAVLEKVNEDQAEKIEDYRFQLSSIRKKNVEINLQGGKEVQTIFMLGCRERRIDSVASG